jgi:hypothetical protein
MPHRRTVKKGSFGDRLDGVVEQFPEERTDASAPSDPERPDDDKDIHDRLFERAWRDSRKETPRTPR